MLDSPRIAWRVEWPAHDGLLVAVEPTPAEVRAAAPALAASYNDAHNAAMMAHSAPMSEDDVVEHFDSVATGDGRAFLLYFERAMMGDADLRHVADGHAEFAFMIGARAAQGKGLGTRFGLMITALAFHELGLERVYAAILPANKASLRSFEKMGYLVDDSAEARQHAEAADEVTVSITRERFEEHHAEARAAIRFVAR